MPNFFNSSKKKREELERQLQELQLNQQTTDQFIRRARWDAEQERIAANARQNAEREEHLRQQRAWLEAQEASRRREEQRLAKERAEEHARREAERKRTLRLKQKRERLKKANPEVLREVRDLIKERFSLDTEIWRLRNVRSSDRKIVLEKMQRSDEVLKHITDMVESWEEASFEDAETWKLALSIRNRIQRAKQRVWADNPPWANNGH